MKISRAKFGNAKIGVLAQAIGQLVAGGIGAILVKVMATNLGPESYGIYTTAFALVGTFSLVTDLGVNTATLREISKAPDNASEIIGHNLGLRLAVCVLAIPLVSFIGHFLYPHAPNGLHLAILLMSAYLIFDTIWSTCIIFFAAKIRNDIVTAVMLSQQVLFLALVVLAAHFKQHLTVFILGYVFSFAISSVIAYRLTMKQVYIRPRVNLGIWRRTVGTSIVLGVISIIDQIYHMADSIILSVVKGVTQVGIYTVAYALVCIFLYFPGYVMGNLTPIIINMADEAKLKKLIENCFYFLTCLGVLVPLVSYFLGKDMVLVVSNKAFASAALPFFILTIGTMFSYIAATFIRTSIALEKQKGLLLNSSATLFLNICLNLFAIPHYGTTGAAVAIVISELFSLIVIITQFRRNVRISINYFLVIRPLIAAVASFAILTYINPLLVTRSIMVNLLIGSIKILMVYATILTLIGGMPQMAKQSINKLLAICKRSATRFSATTEISKL